MQLTKTILTAFGLFIFCSCDVGIWASNYDFETTAIYIAPKTNATATIIAKGYVPKNADLADENESRIYARITFDDRPSHVLKMTLNGFKVLSTTINDTPFTFKDTTRFSTILIDASRTLGITNADSTELIEFSQVILSTGSGPKGTVLKGQGRAIIVDTVRYSTKDR